MGDIYLYLGIYFLIVIGIGWYVSREETKEDFLIAGRDRRGWQILLSKFAGSIGVSWFVTYTAYAYEFGYGVFAAILGMLVGYLLFAYRATPKIYKHSKKKKFYTQGDFVFHRLHDTTSKVLVNFVTSLVQFGWLLIGVVGGAAIISHVGLLSYERALGLTIGIVGVYLLLAGFKSVMITDVFQAFIILILLGFLVFNIIGDTSIIEILGTPVKTMNMGIVIGFLLYGSLGTFALSDRYQLCYSAQSMDSAKRGISFAVVPIVIVASFLLIIGLYMFTQNPHLDPNLVFIEAMTKYLPSSLVSIGIVVFFAGLMSTIDTGIYAIASHYIFSKSTIRNPKKHIRIFIVVLLLITALLSYFYRDIVDISLITGGFTMILPISMIYVLLGYKNHYRFIGSILGGFLFFLLGLLFIGAQPVFIIIPLIGGGLGLLVKNYDLGLLRFKIRNIGRLLKALPGVLRFKWKTWRRKR